MLQFIAPPMPHYIVSGEDIYSIGGKHANRSNIGVFDLIVVTRGGLFLEEGSMALPVPAGSYALLRPDRVHRTAMPCSEETHFYWLHFQTLGRWFEAEEKPLPPSLLETEPYARIEYFSFYLQRSGKLRMPSLVFDAFRHLLQLGTEPSPLALYKQQQLFHEILLHLQEEDETRGDRPYERVAEKAAVYLRRHYKEPLSYQRLAEELHFHQNHIALCMKKTFGCTPLGYVTRYRVEMAKRLLIHTDDPIGRIAEETGFGSFPYFVRCFTKHVGVQPRAFRMEHRV
ncbi:HTH-type transcriptional regulator YesS [Paenibacillus konkukensis]|uniref:HTH-type transcriptional regulator YesS n=1 Tax=Paenibacillus konkukensis TaxID=2020716 RepID=A0ABY4RIH7_9BACL|nr:AraC family transcriptional regulator [Paenibacillus konkukensis]UQZ82197.1 HTH-type transcriptional regulator YesS [Paenibacillus konkukensis]